MRRTLDWFLSEDKAAGDEVKLPHAGEERRYALF